MTHHKRSIEGKLTFHKLLKMKAKRKGMKRPFQEQTIGNSYYHKENKYTWMHRVIDRVHRWYDEIFKDKETGRVIHEYHHPLPEHRGHGSNKAKHQSSS